MKKGKKGLAGLLAVATACSSLGMMGVSAEESNESVNIVWYRTAWTDNADEKLVEEAINEYIEPLIGVTVTVMTDGKDTPLNLALGAGEEIDLFWTSGGRLQEFIDGGIAYDLTDVIKDYPTLYESMPESVWEASQRVGKNYYIPMYKETGTGFGVSFPTELIEKYGWDLSTVKELKDLEPMIADCYADGMEYAYSVGGSDVYKPLALDDFAFLSDYAVVDRDDPTKVLNLLETPEYKEYLDMIYSWNQAGYINPTEASEHNVMEQRTQLIAEEQNAFWMYTQIPDAAASESQRVDHDMTVLPLTKVYVDTDSTTGSAYMINANTEKIDACLKFLGLLSTDETLANLAAYGIEGKHYTLTDEGRVSLIADSGYTYPGVWIVCNVMAPTLMEGEADDKKEQYDVFNANTEISCTAGFTFDKTNVEAEMTALNAVVEEYQLLLERGFYDPETYLPEYQEKLEGAGLETVLAEMQTQYDAWLAANAD